MLTSVFKFLRQQKSGNQREGHHQHGDVGRTQAPLGEPHQAAAPQQQAHVKIQVAQLQQTYTLCGRHTMLRSMAPNPIGDVQKICKQLGF